MTTRQHIPEARCPDCGLPEIYKSPPRRNVFCYGIDDDVALLIATYPTFVCAECGASYTDYEAEDARTEAIERHLAKKEKAG